MNTVEYGELYPWSVQPCVLQSTPVEIDGERHTAIEYGWVAFNCLTGEYSHKERTYEEALHYAKIGSY